MKIKHYIAFSITLLFVVSAYSQSASDSLVTLINGLEGKEKYAQMSKLFDYYTENDTQTASEYANELLEFSRTLKNGELEFDALKEISLFYYHNDLYEEALNYNMQALRKAESLEYMQGRYSASDQLAAIYNATGEPDSAKHYLNQALFFCEASNGKADILSKLAEMSYRETQFQKAKKLYLRAILEAKNSQNSEREGESYFGIAQVYLSIAAFDSSQFYIEQGIELYSNIGDTANMAKAYNLLGVLYKNTGKYDEAIAYYQKALAFFEAASEVGGALQTLGNIGNFYFYYGANFDKALEYYELALEKSKEISDQQAVFNLSGNIGLVYMEKKEYNKALAYFEEGLVIVEQFNFAPGIATVKNNIGTLYAEQENYAGALANFEVALEIYENLGQQKEVAFLYGKLGLIFFKQKKYNQSIDYYMRCIEIAKQINLVSESADFHKEISEVYNEAGDFEEAFNNYVSYSSLKDRIFNEESMKQITELETKYETAKQKQEIELKDTKLKQQQTVTNSLIVGSIFVLLIAFLAYNRFLVKKKANVQLKEQNEEITRHRDQIFYQNEQITDSIQYASRIQSALLPPDEMFDEHIPEHFILNRPRDIVSGDFYWMTQKGNKTIVAAADCTGHGVPGAFMSMLGIAFLNEISNKPEVKHANEVLNSLRAKIIESLRQTGKDGESKDGMDIAMCVIDHDTLTMEYSGAYNPLYLIRNGEMKTVKADKMPIGYYFKGDKPFTNNIIELKKDDRLYIFSDGYIDQFGGPKGRKFMSNRFKELILEMHELPMKEQVRKLNTTILSWMGNDYPQIDDQLVIGMRI